MKVVILGCGGHARSVADILVDLHADAEFVFVDENAAQGERILGRAVRPAADLNGDALLDHSLVLAAGDNGRRHDMFARFRDRDMISLVSRRASVSRFAVVGRGCFVGNHCHVGPEAVVGDATIVNTAAIVEHETVLGVGCHVGPRAVVCGRSRIGDRVFLGAGSTVRDGVTIGPDIVVGAGGVVPADLSEPGVYVGCPVRRIR